MKINSFQIVSEELTDEMLDPKEKLQKKMDSFKGPLAEPFEKILIDPITAFFRREGAFQAALQKKRADEEVQKLVLLLDHYGIDPKCDSRFSQLSLKLAKDFVPGFQEIPTFAEIPIFSVSKGAKKKWDMGVLIDLHNDVEILLSDKSNDISSIVKACSTLAKAKKWKTFLRENDGLYGDTDSAAALRKAYYRLNKERARIKKNHKSYEKMLLELELQLLKSGYL